MSKDKELQEKELEQVAGGAITHPAPAGGAELTEQESGGSRGSGGGKVSDVRG